ncbi:hypothetical protein LHYA1_G009105 [Lachnellula hyalina]|uniref:Uncharacterized protein n=1 Tax=Lachnellula hyalina TaxID=1316788 RepID=A0A8H8QUC8_9HELO|nr:uncharacterized protein LHYA1_G009105 [Lachnellula hyalina]TVY22340.1 hypothetical protein LHYA1_G009105 [Lachnellula hyalina]
MAEYYLIALSINLGEASYNLYLSSAYKNNIRFILKAIRDLLLLYVAYVLPLRQLFLRQLKLGQARRDSRQFIALITKEKFSVKKQVNFNLEEGVEEDIKDELDLIALAKLSNYSYYIFNYIYARLYLAKQVVLVIGTSSSKSLIFIVGALVADAWTTILVLPILALLIIILVEAACTKTFLNYAYNLFLKYNKLVKPRIIRELINRSNIKYLVSRETRPSTLIKKAANLDKVALLANMLGCLLYTAKSRLDKEKAAILSRWLSNAD